MKSKTTYSFKAGDRFHLDSIYAIQGLAGGDWWKRVDEADVDVGEELICAYDIKITIIVQTPDPVDADDAL